MNRGQSETLGFVFVFSLIVLTVGAVYAGGYPALQDARDAERITNMQRAFEVLDDNIDDVVYQDAPSRATEIRLTGGQLAMQRDTTLDVRIANTSNASDNRTFSEQARPITYTDGDTTFALSFGAVLRSDGGNAVMISDPGWLLGPDRAVIPLPQFAPGEERLRVGGDVPVLIVADARSTRSVRRFVPGGGARANVTVTVTSPRAGAWAAYFDAQGMTAVDADPADGEVTYWYETDAVYVPKQRIEIEFSS